MRYFTCNKKGCDGRTFEGRLALSIHQGRKHKKNGNVNGNSDSHIPRLNGETTVPLALSEEGQRISTITTMLDSLSSVGLGYVLVRTQTKFIEQQGGTSE